MNRPKKQTPHWGVFTHTNDLQASFLSTYYFFPISCFLFPILLSSDLQSLCDFPSLTLFLQKEGFFTRIAIFLLSFFYF